MGSPAEGPAPVTLGEAVNTVRWDYDPARHVLSPLVAAARYFQDFPWEGEEDEEAPGPGASPAGE